MVSKPIPTSLTEQVSTASVVASMPVSLRLQGVRAANVVEISVQWDTSGISVFFFPRSSIPADILAEAPLPSTWGLAMARWPAIDCDPFKFFYEHAAIFDTTLWYVLFSDRLRKIMLNKIRNRSGDWAGGVWASAGSPGQEQSCAARTGYATCQEFVQNSGGSFQEACTPLSAP